MNILLIIVLGYILLRLVRSLIHFVANRVSSNRRLSLLYFLPIARLLIIIGIIIIVVQMLVDISEQNVLAILGGLGIIIGFAFKDYLSNLVAGIMVLYEVPFRPGDWIEVNGIYGEVKSIGLRVLEIHTSDDNTYKIPQSVFWNTAVSNSSSGKKDVMCVIEFFIAAEEDPKQIMNLLRDATSSSTYYQYQKGINIIVREKPYYTHYKVKAYPIDARTQFRFSTDVTIRAKELFNMYDIEYASPVQQITE